MPAGESSLRRYRVADLLVDVGRRAVTRGACDIRLSKLSFELLRTLIEAAPNIVSNDELSRAVWHGVVVAPETVTQRVKLLRDALGDDPEAPRYVARLRGHGYRILSPVTLETESARAKAPEIRESTRARTRSRSVAILVGVTALAVAFAYVVLDQLLITRHEEASQAGISSSAIVAVSPRPESTAVLPLAKESGDATQQFFSDGLSEDLITALSQLPGVKVIGRTSSFQFRDSREGGKTIGRKLGVAHLLEGGVRRVGDVVRVTAELVDTSDGSTQWSKHYDRPYKDLFALQDEITRTVAEVLKARLLPDAQSAVQSDRPPSGNLDAYAELLQGKFHFVRDTEVDTREAIEHFERATQLDPSYALAWSFLSRAWHNLSYLVLTGASPANGYEQARVAAYRALALAPNLAAAHFALGNIFQVPDLNWRAAGAEFRRALQLAPEDGDAKYFLGSQLAALGKLDEAVELTRQALGTDPLHASRYGWLSLYLLGLNRLDRAERAILKAIELRPTAMSYHQVQTKIAVARGDPQAALAAAQQEPPGIMRDFALAFARQLGSDQDAADAALNVLISWDSRNSAFFVADVYSIRGDRNKTFEWLDRAGANRDAGLAVLLYDPFILRYKDDPRFAAFCRKVGLPTPAEVGHRT